MAAPPPPVLPAGIAPLLTHMGDPSANGGANPGPLYVLIREDVVFINSHAVCIPVDAAAAIHTEARPNRRPHWRNRSGGDTGLMAAFIATAYPNGILVGNAVEAPGDINSGKPRRGPFHQVKILLNVPPYNPLAGPPVAGVPALGSLAYLRMCVQQALATFYALPLTNPGQAWRVRPNGPGLLASIAFELLTDRGTLGYPMEDAAEHMLAAIQGWFNHAGAGNARKAGIPVVYLLIPTAKAREPWLVEEAWKRAWGRYVDLRAAPASEVLKAQRVRALAPIPAPIPWPSLLGTVSGSR